MMSAPGNRPLLVLQASGFWLLFLLVAVINGGIREQYLEQHLAPLAAHQLSTLLLCCVIFSIAAVFVYTRRITGSMTLLAIGLFWAGLTVIFEFSFFHFFVGKPWPVLLADYNILEGRLFSLVILTTFVAPVIAGRLFAKRYQA